MSTTTLDSLLTGRIEVRVDERTSRGLAPVAAGQLVGGDATGNTLQIRDEAGYLVTVRLSKVHVIAYSPRGGGR